ncbi:MAG: aldehyde dehydrogenase family protein [bacterium]
MNDDSEVRSIVQEVVNRVTSGEQSRTSMGSAGRPASTTSASSAGSSSPNNSAGGTGGNLGAFTSASKAIEAAGLAFKEFRGQNNLSLRKKIIAGIRELARDKAREWAEKAVKETGFGRIEDKVAKITLCAEKTPGVDDIQPEVTTGDHGLTLEEFAPWGVIGSITPSTNPAATMVNNSISMIAAGNAVVFNPHPAAKNVCVDAIQEINRVIQNVGAPQDLLAIISEPTLETAQEIFHHDDIPLLSVTGGEAVVEEAMKASKRVIGAGPGNPPVVVDETADICRAGQKIVEGASFDNNIMCTCEKEILAVEEIADDLMYHLCQNGGYQIDEQQTEQVANLVLEDYPGDNPSINNDWVGKNAAVIAENAGFNVPDETRLLIPETGPDHPLARLEQLMPVVPLIRVPNVDQAIDLAVKLEDGCKHSAAMHSQNIENMHRMAVEMNTSIFVKNGSNLNAMGHNGEGWTSMTISTPTGEGITSARTFVRRRRCALVDYFRIV